MKITIFYYSGTGNTKWIVKNLKSVLCAAGNECSVISVFSLMGNGHVDYPMEILDSELFIIAYPIYGATIPGTMKLFIEGLCMFLHNNDVAKKNAVLMNNYAYVNGAGLFHIKRFFRNSPIKIDSFINVRTTNTAPSCKQKSAAIGDDMPYKKKNRALKRLEAITNGIHTGRKRYMGIGPHLLVGIIIRSILKNEIRNNYKKMEVDMSLCTLCMACVKNCPTGSILHSDGSFTFLESCDACMRCYNHCPVNAISNKGS